jgi:hypothetical protein
MCEEIDELFAQQARNSNDFYFGGEETAAAQPAPAVAATGTEADERVTPAEWMRRRVDGLAARLSGPLTAAERETVNEELITAETELAQLGANPSAAKGATGGARGLPTLVCPQP